MKLLLPFFAGSAAALIILHFVGTGALAVASAIAIGLIFFILGCAFSGVPQETEGVK